MLANATARSASETSVTWSKRATAFRTCAASVSGSFRSLGKAKTVSGRSLRVVRSPCRSCGCQVGSAVSIVLPPSADWIPQSSLTPGRPSRRHAFWVISPNGPWCRARRRRGGPSGGEAGDGQAGQNQQGQGLPQADGLGEQADGERADDERAVAGGGSGGHRLTGPARRGAAGQRQRGRDDRGDGEADEEQAADGADRGRNGDGDEQSGGGEQPRGHHDALLAQAAQRCGGREPPEQRGEMVAADAEAA